MAQVSRAVFRRGCSNCNENNVAMLDGLACIVCESNAAIGPVAVEQVFQTRLVDRHFAISQEFDLFLILVHAQDFETQVSQTSACDQAHVTRSDDCDSHDNTPEVKGDVAGRLLKRRVKSMMK
jgi:hypothetical protein